MRLIEKPTWDFREEIVSRCPSAYFVHSPRFMDFCVQALPNATDCSLGFVFDDGTKGFIPFVGRSHTRDLLYNYESSFLGYGGLITEKQIDKDRYQEAMDAALTEIYKQRHYQILISTKPADGSAEFSPISKRLVSWTKENTNTHIVELNPDYEKVYEQFKYFRKKNIRTSERAGVEVKLVSNDDELEEFFVIYRDRVRRWGKSARTNFDRRFFQAAYQTMCADRRMQLWIASHNKHIYAGAIILYQGQSVHAWLSASLEDDSHRPYSYLQTAIIKDACARGLTFYDLGRSISGGVARFKEGFGATLKPFNIYLGYDRIMQGFLSVYKKVKSPS